MKMYDTPHALSDYLNETFECDCGKSHAAPLKYVSVRPGAIEDLPVFMGRLGLKSAYLICDEMTRALAADRCMEILQEAGVKGSLLQLKHLEFDEATLGEILINMPDDCDVVVAVGTGSINDMCRYFSYRMGRPFFTVATAAPMDGFASSLAVLNINNLKTSIETHCPLAIMGDVDILKNAPYRMIAAGLGDLLGKSTCLCDWKLSRIINHEHTCDRIIELVEDCVKTVLDGASAAKERDPQVIGDIMSGLVLSGVAMSLYGNSRPASGCEHHMSHYWEQVCALKGVRPAPHGIQVGVGTVLVLKAVEELLTRTVDFEAAREAAKAYSQAEWEKKIEAAYGPAAPGVIDMENASKKNETAGRLTRIDVMEKNWDAITELLRALPSAAYVQELLESLGAPSRPEEIDVDKALLKDTFMYCKEIRARYTIFQMLWDLELLDSVSDAVVAGL